MRSFMSWLAVVLTFATAASAQEEGRFPVERFRPAIDGTGVLDVDSGQVGTHLQWSAGAFANYAFNPLVFVDRDGNRLGSLVTHRVGLDVVAALSLFDWLQLGVDVPTVLFQTRDDSVNGILTNPGALNAAGIGDLRLLSKVRLLRARDGHAVDLAIIPAITVPTGYPTDGSGNYIGEGQLTFAPEVAISRDFRDDSVDGAGLVVAANVGFRYRPEQRSFVNVVVGNEVTARVGAGYRLPAIPLTIEGSVNAATRAQEPFTSGFEENPLEVIGGVSYDVMPFLRVTGGVGKGLISGVGTPDVRGLLGVRIVPVDDDRDDDGIKNGADSCPDDPEDKDGFKDEDGCPDLDNDGDGIFDFQDKCPDVAEDKDGHDDMDGCPEEEPADRDGDGIVDEQDRCPDNAGPKATMGCPDRDGDGFVDIDDKCPDEPEVVNGVDDDDGCPDIGKTVVKLTKEKIEILDRVYFDVDKDTIQARSFSLLDQVATVLRSHAELTLVRIEGHTDSDGSDAHNLDLSDRRANAVQRYLVDKGVSGTRLQAVGYGETRPVQPNDSAANKELNRRVEFVIASLDGVPTNAAPTTTAPTSIPDTKVTP